MTSSANEALSLSKNLIDLDMILMDIYPLSSKDSEIIAEIQQDSRYANTPKVALLADNSKESIDEVTKKDFVSYICKPIVAHELYKILKDSITPKAKATIEKEMRIEKKMRFSIVDNGKNHYDLKDLGFNLCENEKRFREFYVVAKNSDKKVKALLNINRRNKAIELLESVKLAAINICATTLVDTISHLIETIDINSEKSYLLSHRFAENLEIVMKKIEMLEKEPIKR
jgi:CheY-like chemotaxis protein